MTHLETFLDTLKGLPNDFQRSFSLMHNLDRKSNKLKRKLEADTEDLLRLANHKQAKGAGGTKASSEAVPSITEPTLAQLDAVRQSQWELYNYSNEKIALADQASTMIKAFVTRLDEDIKKLEDILGPEVPPEPVFEPPKRKVDRSKREGANKSAPPHTTQGPPVSSNHSVSARTTHRSPPPPRSVYHSMVPGGGPGPGGPNKGSEPIYCHCQQVSFGEMVGCDGDECRFEWFHLTCVGLKKPPKGKWYCEDCR